MTTTEFINQLKEIEFGRSGRPREITFYYKTRKDIKKGSRITFDGLDLCSTGDGCCGAEVDFRLTDNSQE